MIVISLVLFICIPGLSEDDIKYSFLNDYRNSLSDITQSSFQYTTETTNSDRKTIVNGKIDFVFHYFTFYNNLCELGNDKISEYLMNDTVYLNRHEFNGSEIYSSYFNQPQNLFTESISNLDVAPIFGYFYHSLPDIAPKNTKNNFHSENGIYFIPEIIEMLINEYNAACEITVNNGINEIKVFMKNNDISFEVIIVPEYNYMVKYISYNNGKSIVGDVCYYCYSVNSTQKVDGIVYPKLISLEKNIQGGHDVRDGIKFSVDNTRFQQLVTLNNLNNNNSVDIKNYQLSKGIDNGADIKLIDTPQLEYIWMDGKIVPKTDERMLAIAQGGNKFMPGPKESRFWLIFLGIVGILVGGGWKLYDFWTSDREPTSPPPKDQAI